LPHPDAESTGRYLVRIPTLVLGLCLAACGHANRPAPEAAPLPADFAGEWRVTVLDTISHEPLLGGTVHWRIPDWQSADARNFPRCTKCWVGTASLAVPQGAHRWQPGSDLALIRVDHGKTAVSFGMIPGTYDDGHLVADLVPAGGTLTGRALSAGVALLPIGQLVLERVP